MSDCDYCGQKIDGLPFKCVRCGKYFCSEHRMPEDHECKPFNSWKNNQEKSWNKNVKEIITQKSKSKNYKSKNKPFHKKSVMVDDGHYEMYQPKRRGHKYRPRRTGNFNVRRFFKKYINFRIQTEVQPYIMQFLLIFVIGIVLNYVYYQSFSLHYLFIGGINEWFGVLSMFLNGFSGGYDLFYLIINGIYYGYFYYYLIMVIFSILKNINKRDTWIMLGWFAIIGFLVNKIFTSNIF